MQLVGALADELFERGELRAPPRERARLAALEAGAQRGDPVGDHGDVGSGVRRITRLAGRHGEPPRRAALGSSLALPIPA